MRIFTREVQDALPQMKNLADRKCLLRMVVANKITGPAKDLIGSQECDSWEGIKELLLNYYDVRDALYNHLKNQRNNIIQRQHESVAAY